MYCAPEPIADMEIVEPGYTGVEVQVLIDNFVTMGVKQNCWVRAYGGDLISGHSNHLVFTPYNYETIVLPVAPNSLTIIWD